MPFCTAPCSSQRHGSHLPHPVLRESPSPRSLRGSPFLLSFLPAFLPPVPSVSGRCAAGGARGTPERLGTAGLGLARPGTAGLGAAARQAEAGPNFGSSAGPRAARRGVCGCRYRRLLLPTRAERSPVI